VFLQNLCLCAPREDQEDAFPSEMRGILPEDVISQMSYKELDDDGCSDDFNFSSKKEMTDIDFLSYRTLFFPHILCAPHSTQRKVIEYIYQSWDGQQVSEVSLHFLNPIVHPCHRLSFSFLLRKFSFFFIETIIISITCSV
jgi:hypothetical protein